MGTDEGGEPRPRRDRQGQPGNRTRRLHQTAMRCWARTAPVGVRAVVDIALVLQDHPLLDEPAEVQDRPTGRLHSC